MLKKRGREEIIFDILTLCLEPKDRDDIYYKCNLNTQQMIRYLPLVQEKGLLYMILDYPKPLYTTTQKGQEYIETFKKIKETLGELMKE